MCDQTKEIQTLYGSMPNKWIISSSGRYMFVRFRVDNHGTTYGASSRFKAKIHYGMYIYSKLNILYCLLQQFM